jgi:transposase-like protein
VVALLEEAEGDILSFYDFPPEHQRQIASTNCLERLNKELKRRSAVVGIFPNRAAVVRLFGALRAEQTDEWLVSRRYFSEVSMRRVLHRAGDPPALLQEEEQAV